MFRYQASIAQGVVVSFKYFGRILRALKHISLIVISISAVYVVVRLGLNYSGYCYEQKRYLTDQEKIEIAVREILRFYPPTLTEYGVSQGGENVVRWFSPEKAIPYQSVEDFFKINKECCEITDYEKGDFGQKGERISRLNKLLGDTSDNVRVRYRVRYFDERGSLMTRQYESYIAISNCGHPH